MIILFKCHFSRLDVQYDILKKFPYNLNFHCVIAYCSHDVSTFESLFYILISFLQSLSYNALPEDRRHIHHYLINIFIIAGPYVRL